MNELIEELWVKFSYDTDISFYGETPESSEELMDYHDFKQAIQTACKAQRNACAREFRRYSQAHEYKISNNWAKAISMSKIERCDYE